MGKLMHKIVLVGRSGALDYAINRFYSKSPLSPYLTVLLEH